VSGFEEQLPGRAFRAWSGDCPGFRSRTCQPSSLFPKSGFKNPKSRL
jgi:hypothetical protein